MTSFEKVQTRLRLSYVKLAVLGAVCLDMLILKDVDGARDLVPEPFDVMDHAGNVNQSALIGLAAALVLALRSRDTKTGFINSSPRITRAKFAGAGLIAGVIANALVETKFGVGISGFQNTVDTTDFVYGVTAATATAALMPGFEEVRVGPEQIPLSAQELS